MARIVWISLALVLLGAVALTVGCLHKPAAQAPEIAASPPTGEAPAAPAEPGAAEPAAPGTGVSPPPGTPPAPGTPGTPGTTRPPAPPAGTRRAAPSAPQSPGAAAPARGAPSALTGEFAQMEAARKKVTSYEMTVNTGGDRPPMKSVLKLQDGKPVRSRAETPRGTMLVMRDQRVSYVIAPDGKTATKMSWGQRGERGDFGGGFMGRFSDLAMLQARKPKITSTTLNGLACWLLEWTDEWGGQTVKSQVWIDKQYGLTRQSKRGDFTTTFTYSRINAVPTSEFELPKGVQVKEFKPGEGPPGAPGGWGGPGAPGGPGRPRGEGGPGGRRGPGASGGTREPGQPSGPQNGGPSNSGGG